MARKGDAMEISGTKWLEDRGKEGRSTGVVDIGNLFECGLIWRSMEKERWF